MNYGILVIIAIPVILILFRLLVYALDKLCDLREKRNNIDIED